jgi:hypothetical protein
LTIPVTFNVLNSRQAFSAAPAGINVSYPANADLIQTVTTPVQVWNSGGAAVTVTAAAMAPAAGAVWLTVTPAQFTLIPGQAQAFSVTVDGSKVFTGTHLGTIALKGPGQEVDLPVQLSVVGPVTVVQPGISIKPQAVVQCVRGCERPRLRHGLRRHRRHRGHHARSEYRLHRVFERFRRQRSVAVHGG